MISSVRPVEAETKTILKSLQICRPETLEVRIIIVVLKLEGYLQVHWTKIIELTIL